MLDFTFSFSHMPCLPNGQLFPLYNALVLWLYHKKNLFYLPAFIPPPTGGQALPRPRHLSKGHCTLNIKYQEEYLISTKSKGAGYLHSDTTNRPSTTGSSNITTHPCWIAAHLPKVDGIKYKDKFGQHSPEDTP